jgi:hypothetical protein
VGRRPDKVQLSAKWIAIEATRIGPMIHATDTQVGSSYVLFRQKAKRLPSWLLANEFD